MKYFLFCFISLFFLSCGDNKIIYYTEENISEESSFFEEDNYFYQQWHLKKDDTFYARNGIDDEAHIHISDEILNKYTGQGIKVAVIDNGFDIEHPELKNNIIATVAFDNNGIKSNDVSHDGNEYHGTAVTGLIVSSLKLRGIAPDVELILIKMPQYLDDPIVESMFDTALEYGAQIINCSWGTNAVTKATRDYINSIATEANNAQGVNIIFAAGNSNQLISTDESSIKNVVGVGALNHTNLRATSYSNYGPELDISAPSGDTIGLTTIDVMGSKGASSNSYNELDFIGTSAAAPIVSGVLALLLESNTSLTKSQIDEKLFTTTDLIGENTPYIDEMISSSNFPNISGLLGTSQNDSFIIRLTNKSTQETFENEITTINGDNTFSSIFSQEIPNGDYIVELVSSSNFIYATDGNFIISDQLTKTNVDKTKRHSDFYGKGKINVTKLFEK